MSRRVAVVSGAGGGIGSAICDAIAHDTSLVALDIAGDRAEEVARHIRARGGSAVARRCDVSVGSEVDAAVSATERDLGPPSILVHAAGDGGPFHSIDEVSEDEWGRVVRANLTSAFLLSKRLLPGMRALGFGRIVFIASIQGLFGARLSAAYSASKHGVVGLARTIAVEWGPFGITSNAVCPGYVNTPMGPQPQARPGHTERILELTPSKRIAEPNDVASMVEYLVSDAARHVNGAVLTVDGGITADVGI
jgi:3-oxoacyl-[acyl-carrier protein] reductase